MKLPMASLRPSPARPVLPWPALAGTPASLDLVDNEAMCGALDSRWPACDPLQPGARRGLLLIDPAGRWADAIMGKLAAPASRPAQRIRLLSPSGLRKLATIDELSLPATGDQPTVVRHLRAHNLSPSHGSPGMTRLWQQSALVALLVGTLPSDTAARWVLSACAVAARLGPTGPRWAVFMPNGASEQPRAGTCPDWLAHMSFLAQPGAHAGEGSSAGIWAAVLESWAALPE
jgi:hypothetical protein